MADLTASECTRCGTFSDSILLACVHFNGKSATMLKSKWSPWIQVCGPLEDDGRHYCYELQNSFLEGCWTLSDGSVVDYGPAFPRAKEYFDELAEAIRQGTV